MSYLRIQSKLQIILDFKNIYFDPPSMACNLGKYVIFEEAISIDQSPFGCFPLLRIYTLTQYNRLVSPVEC